MKKKSHSQKDDPKQMLARDIEKDVLVPFPGAAIPGFNEDWQFYRYETVGVGFKSLRDVVDSSVMDASGSRSPGADFGAPDEGRAIAPQEERDETTNPEDMAGAHLAPVDLRYGGEDISGISEWSLRAQHLQLDDGLDSGDFARSDERILLDILEIVEKGNFPVTALQCDVRAGEVMLRGTMDLKANKDLLERVIQAVPGVKELRSYLE